MTSLTIHNNLTRRKQRFEPQNPDCVTIYVCGPTVYGAPHIGNARPAVVFDVLVRLLRHLFPAVRHAANITDIDDKIIARAAEEGVETSEIAARYRDRYHADMAALGVRRPDIEPYATEHLAPMLAMIATLIDKGAAYEAEGHVLFDITKDADYGTLSRRDAEARIAGARVEVAPYKRDAGDFVLWKPSPPEMPGWESPWGRGRPGWHIECSAMIAAHLGETIDIHGGGGDLLFPHHENEAAQSRCAHGAPLARFWVHNGMVNMAGEKMSKSLGNIRAVGDILEGTAGEAVRLALLQAHYRSPLDFSDDLLTQCVRNLDRLYGALRETSDLPAAENAAPPEAFLAALCDDLNTPKALAELFALSKNADTPEGKGALLAAGRLLGLLEQNPEDWFADTEGAGDIAAIEDLIKARNKARAAKDYARADAVRDELADMGIAIEDGADGTKWRRMR